MAEQASFEALIKNINIKSLVSGDKEAELKIRFIPNDYLLDCLNKLHKADGFVRVKITDEVQ